MKDTNNYNNSRPSHSPSLVKPRALLSTIPAVTAAFLLGYLLGLLSFAFTSSYSPPSQFTNSNSNFNSTPKQQQQNSTLKIAPPHDLFRFRTQCSPPIPQPQILPTILHHVFNDSSPYADGFPSAYTSSLLLPPTRRLRPRPRGWGSTNPVFRDLISPLQPLTIIEIGTFLGASALHMAALTRNLSSLILCLDDFRGWPGFRAKIGRDVPRQRHGDSLLLHQFMANVAAAGETERVLPVPFSTASALAALCEWGVYGDLIEVDAGHDFHSAWTDINMAWAVLRPDGVMFGHDYFTAKDDRGVRRAVNLFAEMNGLRVRANGEHWVLSPKPER